MWGKRGIKLFFAFALVLLQALGVVAKKAPQKKSPEPKLKRHSCDDLDGIKNLIVKFKPGKDGKLNAASFEKKYRTKTFKFKKVFKERAFAEDKELHDFYLLDLNEDVLQASHRKRNLFLETAKPYNQCLATQEFIEDLNTNPDIEYAEPDFVANISSTIQDTFYNATGSWGQDYDDQWALKKIEADRAWTYTEGEKAVVAVIDTGVDYNHPDLWDNIWVNPEYASDTNNDGLLNLNDLDTNRDKKLDSSEIIPGAIGVDLANNDYNPIDDQGHGTHVTGIIAAAKNDIGVVGVAPQAKILIIKVMNDKGQSSYSDLAKAILYAAKYADVANNSWTGDQESETIKNALAIASGKGLINIAAAGNSNSSKRSYPGAYTDYVISVGSTNVLDQKSKFSNYGKYVTIYAPGGGESENDKYVYKEMNILSTMAADNNYRSFDYLFEEDGEALYMRMLGTSMSTGYVTGVAALLKSMKKKMTFAEVRKYIVDNADGTAYKRINAYDAVYKAKSRPVNVY